MMRIWFKTKIYYQILTLLIGMGCYGILGAEEGNHKKNIGDHFLNEKLEYSLSFFPFFNAAEAEITFKKDSTVKNGYIAELKAETTGIIKLLTFKRRDRYVSYMIMMDNGKRLQSVKFEKISKRGGREARKGITEFNYQNHQINWTVWNGDKLAGQGSRDIPDDTVYDDPLCAFFNLRYGVYGEVEPGKAIDVKTIPKEEEKKLQIQFATEEEISERNKNISKHSPREYLIRVMTDKDLFENNNGEVEIWLSKELVPIEGVVKGVVLIGDVRGILRNKPHKGG